MILIEKDSLILLPIHYNEQYKEQVLEILNYEWPNIDRTERISLFNQSCDRFPTSYVLISTAINNLVLGHCRIDVLFNSNFVQNGQVLLESV